MREERLTVMEDAMKRATCRGAGAQRHPAHPLSLQHCLPNGILPGDIFAYGNGAYGLWKGLLCPPHPPRAGGGRGQARGGAGGRQGRPPGAQHGAGGEGQKPRPHDRSKQNRLLSVKPALPSRTTTCTQATHRAAAPMYACRASAKWRARDPRACGIYLSCEVGLGRIKVDGCEGVC